MGRAVGNRVSEGKPVTGKNLSVIMFKYAVFSIKPMLLKFQRDMSIYTRQEFRLGTVGASPVTGEGHGPLRTVSLVEHHQN